MIDILSKRIWDNPIFQNEFKAVLAIHMQSALHGQEHNSQVLTVGYSQRLLQSAAILCQSTIRMHREAAYRIAVCIKSIEKAEDSTIDDILYLILSRMGNFPAISFFKTGDKEPPSGLPLAALLEANHVLENNTVHLNETSALHLTNFQKSIWETLTSGGSLAASAPTSAGKSFILQAFIRKFWSDFSRPNILYLVPTRALINQVSLELSDSLKKDGHEDFEIVTIPIPEEEVIPKNSIFILTQERLQILLMNHPDLIFSLAIIDEAQSLADGSRGIILLSVLEELNRKNPNIQMFFACPNIKNPEIFGEYFSLKNFTARRSEDITVSQNLIHVVTDLFILNKANCYLHLGNERIHLASIKTDDDMPNQLSATLQIAYRLGSEGQSLVYAKGIADCHNLALGLYQINEDIEIDEKKLDRLKELANFARESVHPSFLLAETVTKAVGFHYGALPPLLRRSVEDCFRDGDLQFLACTSTLLHGLNLPAKNLFINKPYTGSDQPIDSVNFWNLAGRAGRLGQEFEGNVFLIDYQDWPSKPMEGNKDFIIRPTITNHTYDNTEDFCSYMMDPNRDPDHNGKDEFENTFSKLFDDHYHGRLEESLSASGIKRESEKFIMLKEALDFARKQVKLSHEILSENPTVSVYRQQRLYDYFIERLEEKDPTYLMPLHPEKAGAREALEGIFRRGHKYIFQWKPADKVDKRDKRAIRAAGFALPWMKGTPIPMIIDDQHARELKRNPNHAIAKSINETLEYIEKDIRFTYVKLTSCYNNLLKHALIQKGFLEEAEHLVSLPLFLEVGASSQTMMSFIGMGLSRITAKKLTDKAGRQSLGVAEAKPWLRRQNLEALGFSPILINEIRKIL